MQLFTFSDLKTKLGNDYDITDEVWVNDEELCGYINDAIDDAEGAIHNMHHEDKYFLTSATLALVSGQSDYTFPSDIYGNKIRKFYYVNGTKKYELERIRRIEDTILTEATDDYRYIVVNTMANKSPRYRVFPTPVETGNLGIIWYVRNMFRVTTDLNDATNVCEVPECINFVTQHVKYNLAKKSRNPTMIQTESADRTLQYNLMLEALKDMTLDENTLMEMDLAHYDYYGLPNWR